MVEVENYCEIKKRLPCGCVCVQKQESKSSDTRIGRLQIHFEKCQQNFVTFIEIVRRSATDEIHELCALHTFAIIYLFIILYATNWQCQKEKKKKCRKKWKNEKKKRNESKRCKQRSLTQFNSFLFIRSSFVSLLFVDALLVRVCATQFDFRMRANY